MLSVVKRQPTSVSVVSLSEEHALRVAELFHQPWFRCYPGPFDRCIVTKSHADSNAGNDPIGVELAGALKNVYAIASGVAAGMGYQSNTKAGGSIVSLHPPDDAE